MSSGSTNNGIAWTPPKVWKYNEADGAKSNNRPTAGARFESKLPIGKHPIQLYSMATPNGQKVTMMLEELIEAGIGVEYDAWLINIMKTDHFGSDYVDMNPNSKIPAMRIYDDGVDKPPTLQIFESGSILLYLAERYNKFLPADPKMRTETMSWLFWQMASAPILGGGFGHFYAFAPTKQEYPIERFTMEIKRQLDVLEKQLTKTGGLGQFLVGGGDEMTIADLAIFPWYGGVVLNRIYNAAEYLNVEQEYPHLLAWSNKMAARPAIVRGHMVNKVWGDKWDQLPERHEKNDFDTVPKKPEDDIITVEV